MAKQESVTHTIGNSLQESQALTTAKSHQPQLVDGSYPAYKTAAPYRSKNPTNRWGWRDFLTGYGRLLLVG
ncbi:MAG TPA: hypothetical protein VJ124_02590 [Pyrinomonadaceae bacterium]|nr:hypothetical protein [Pyrinomonadaceae bacterium]